MTLEELRSCMFQPECPIPARQRNERGFSRPMVMGRHCPKCGALPHRRCKDGGVYIWSHQERWQGKTCDCKRCVTSGLIEDVAFALEAAFD